MEKKRIEVDDIGPTSFDLVVTLLGGVDGTPLSNTKYRLVLPDGDDRTGVTDDDGLIKEENLPAGQAKLYLDPDDKEEAQKAIADAREVPESGDESTEGEETAVV